MPARVIWRIEGVGAGSACRCCRSARCRSRSPTKWTIHLGEPLEAPAAGADAAPCARFVARVRERLQGSAERRHPAPPRRCSRETRHDALRRRHRPGHHRHHGARARPRGRVVGPRLPRVHAALSEARLGRARRRGDLARHARACCARRVARAASRGRERRRPSASRTSARRRWCGIARRARRSTARSCGRTGGRRRAARSCAPRARAAGARADRASCSTRTSAARSSRGCSSTSTAPRARRARRAVLRHDRHLADLEAHRRARCTRPTRPTRRARCSTTSTSVRWDDELCRLLGVPRGDAAGGAPSSGVFGETDAGDPRRSPVPITGIAGDQQAALFGQGCASSRAARRTPTAPAASC